MGKFSLNEQQVVQLHDVASRVGTPFYLYDANALRQRVSDLQTQLPQVDFFYSLKANPNMSVVSTLVGAGTGAEVSSRLELETALEAGAVPSRLLMVGPGKSGSDLERAVQLGIKAIVVESLDELDEIDRIAAIQGRVQSVALRINPDFQVHGARLAMSGRATQFGIDQSEMLNAVNRAQSLPHLRLAGLHIYMGTRILKTETLSENTRQILNLANDLIGKLAAPLDFVDIGGGFGVPYYEDEPTLHLARVGEALRPLINMFMQAHPNTRVAIELGRYMVAEAGLFVTKIVQVKTSKNEQFAVCDGGSNLHTAAAGQGFMRRNFPFTLLPATPRSLDETSVCAMTGPLCTPMDVILSAVDVANPIAGDLVCIHQSGAYGPTASPVNFLGFGGPSEVMVDGDRLTVVHSAPSWQERLAAQRPQPVCTPERSENAPLPEPFNHAVLDRLTPLRGLFETIGSELETDPGAWSALWDNATVRALTTIGVPDSHNGFGLADTDLGIEDCNHSLHVAVIERLARFDPSCILALPGPSLSGGAVLAAGSDAQIDQFFKAYRSGPQGTFFAVTEPEVGSDASKGTTIVTTDSRGRMLLNGTKMLIGGVARAKIGLVFAQMENTGAAVLVMLSPANHSDCLTITRLPASGLAGADLCQLEMRDVPITADMLIGARESGATSLRDGFMAINGVFERNRPVVAALALGNAAGMLDRLEKAGYATAFAGMRRRYVGLLGRLALVLEDQARGRPRSHRISEVKYQAIAFSDDLVRRITSEAATVMFSDALLRRKMRDAKAFEYMEGTSNIHLLNAFRSFASEVPA
ncbi:MAG: acyl-CoA dehydrogenase family protein [Pseudoruegeria sp.]